MGSNGCTVLAAEFEHSPYTLVLLFQRKAPRHVRIMTRSAPLDEISGLALLAAAATVASTLALAVAIIVFALVSLVVGHTETLEAIWWLAGFVIVAPLAAWGAGRLLAAADAPAGRFALTAAAPGALLALCGSLLLARAVGSLPGGAVPLPWSLLIVLVLPVPIFLLAVRQRALLTDAGRTAPLAAATVAAAGLLGVAAFLPVASRDPAVIARTLALLAAALAAGAAMRGHSANRRVRLALAVLIPVALALLAWDVSFQPNPSHQDFYLGPANDIRHGRYMLVDDYSQYGVTVIYFLAAILAPLPFGYGSFVLVLGVLTSLMFVTIYAVLRVATQSVAFAGFGTLVALMSSSIATLDRSAQYPSTGFLRFGIPWLLVCALVVAYRRDRPARKPLVIAYALVGVAVVWSVETALYTVATFIVTVVALAWTRMDGTRARYAGAHLGAGAGAAALAMAILVAATEVGRGTAPHIGGYLDFLRLYSIGGFGTLPVPDWSLGYLMGAFYVVSLTAIAVILRHARGSALARPSTIAPLAAVTGSGAAFLTYFLGRSHPNNLTHIAPSFVAMVALWAGLAWRGWKRECHPVAAVGVALAVSSAALLVAQQLPLLRQKAPDSALTAIVRSVTGGQTLSQNVRTLTDLPVISPGAQSIEVLVRSNVPRAAPLLVAVDPAQATEALIRLDRSDVLPIGAPEQDGLSPSRRQALRLAASAVPCGAYVVTQDAPLKPGPAQLLFEGVLAVLRTHYSFHAVAAASGYRVFKLVCNPAGTS